jgi:hypothetical protein
MVQYQLPLSLQVTVNDVVIKPYIVEDNKDLRTVSNICGANTFFYLNRTIHYVMNGDPACQPHVQIMNSVFITMRLKMSVTDFFSNDVGSSFVNKVCAFLGVSTDKLKIVGVQNPTSRLRGLAATDITEVSAVYDGTPVSTGQ